MCKEDVKLGRRTRLRMTVVSLTTSSGVVVRADPNRVALIFHRPPTNFYTVSPNGVTVISQGLTIAATGATLNLRIEDYGEAVTREWTGISDTAGQDIAVWEVILETELLPLEEDIVR